MNMFYSFAHKLRSDLFLPLSAKPTTLQLILGAVMPFSTALFIGTLSKNVPYYDQWYFIPLLDSFYNDHVTFGALWEQHNEHRLVFPRLLMLTLASLTHWSIWAEIACSVVMAIITFLLLCRAADYTVIPNYADRGPVHKRPYTLYILFLMILFSPLQGDNWIWGWQLQIFMSVMATVVGFYAIVFYG